MAHQYSIRAYIGYFGSGKTLSMVYDCLPFMHSGRKIYTNFPLFVPIKGNKKVVYPHGGFVEDPNKFIELFKTEHDSMFLIDEANRYISNYTWQNLPQSFWSRMAQIRKLKYDIWYTTQRYTHVAKRLRDLTKIVVDCISYKIPLLFIKETDQYGFSQAKRFTLFFRNIYLDPDRFLIRSPMTNETLQKYIIHRKFLFPWDYRIAYRAYDTMYEIVQGLDQLVPEARPKPIPPKPSPKILQLRDL